MCTDDAEEAAWAQMRVRRAERARRLETPRFGAGPQRRGLRGPARRAARHEDEQDRETTEQAAGGGREYQAWLATQNIGTLRDREDQVLDWAVQEGFDVLALQEVRLDVRDRQRFTRKAKERGYRACFGHRDLDTCGTVTRGVAMIVRAQGEEVPWVQGMPDPRRVQAFKCHRAQAEPLLILNIYMPAGQGPDQIEERIGLTQKTLEWAIQTGLSFIALGDWNAEQTEEVPLWMTIRGGMRRADEGWEGQMRTTTNAGGERIIDYALVKGQVHVTARRQARAHSPTHDFVAYRVGFGGRI